MNAEEIAKKFVEEEPFIVQPDGSNKMARALLVAIEALKIYDGCTERIRGPAKDALAKIRGDGRGET